MVDINPRNNIKNKNLTIYFVYHKSLVGKVIARYSYFLEIKKYGILKSIWYTIKGVPIEEPIVSHVFVSLGKYAFDIDIRYGVVIKDLPQLPPIAGTLNDLLVFEDERKIVYIKRIEIDEETEINYLFKLLDLYIKQYRADQILKYNFGDLIGFIIPSVKGHEETYICSEFVLQFLCDINYIPAMPTRRVSPNWILHNIFLHNHLL